MAITIKPSALNLSGNLSKIVVNGIVSHLPFKLYKNDVLIVEETYQSDNRNEVTIDIKDLIENELSLSIPSVGSDFFHQSNGSANFKAIVGTEEVLFTVVKGGVDVNSLNADNFLASNFLTWQPQQKLVQYYDPEWLTYFAKEIASVQVKAYFTGSVEQEITIGSIPAGRLSAINVNYGHIRGKLSDQPLYFDVWIEVAGVRQSFVQRYIITTEEFQYDDLFVFENTVGGIDTVRFIGQSRVIDNYDTASALMDDVTSEYFSESTKSTEKNSGFFRSDRHRLWALELFASTQRYHVTEGVLKRILVTKPELNSIKGELNSFSFTFQPAKQTKLLNLSRADSLPTNLEIIGPGDEVFFLAPRLNEFANISSFNDVIFPAQQAFTGEWRKYSYSRLLNEILSAIDTAGGGGGIHNHSNKELLDSLSEVDNYLLIDFEKIKAGFADKAYNSDRWNNLLQPDYLDQPVRKQDEPKFKGTGSEEFTSGFAGSGWQIKKEENGDVHATVDKLTVRKSLSVYELIINQIRATNGSLWVSDSAKIIEVEALENDQFKCYIDTDDNNVGVPFRMDDIIRCQNWTGRNLKYYTAAVTGIGTDHFTIEIIDGTDTPEANEDLVRIGNKTDKNRQGALYLTASDDGAPFMDILDGVDSSDLTGKVKARLGNLDGIFDALMGEIGGYGLYTQNIFARGRFVQRSGDGVTEKIVPVYKGPFNPNEKYYPADQVTFLGSMFINIVFAPIGILPTDENYWEESVEKGQDAQLITLTGDQTFVYSNDINKTVDKESIELVATEHNFVGGATDRIWEYFNGSSWVAIPNTFNMLTYILNHNSPLFNGTNSVSIRFRVGDLLDQMTIVKLYSGESALTVVVTSEFGDQFLNGNISTTLYATVYWGGENITDTIPSSGFSWKRTSSDSAGDLAWNAQYGLAKKNINIDDTDVHRKASFSCEVEIDI